MPEPVTLSRLIASAGAAEREISTPDYCLKLRDFASHSPFGSERRRFTGRSVVLSVRDMAKVAAALIDLDGLARRILLCPPGWGADKMESAASLAQADALACDEDGARPSFSPDVMLPVRLPLTPRGESDNSALETEWILPTSGTSGAPKLAVHTLASLIGAIAPAPLQEWATFYDIRRYGGAQIFLRALAGRGSLRLSGVDEPMEDFLKRLGSFGVTHISGTPTHWRKAILSGAAARISPQYVRLSGEIADDSILSSLATTFPFARIEHAFASTEAGVVFVVSDGRAGFPAEWLRGSGRAEMKIIDGSLCVKTSGAAKALLGDGAPAIAGVDGFIDTGDMIVVRGDRCFFSGRRSGVINVGGAKVHPEEVEAVLNSLDYVRAARVFGKSSPITGALVAADIVLADPSSQRRDVERDIMAAVRMKLPAYMAPARIRFVDELPMTEAGKLRRNG
jgi:acyl-coenzyme A synthetase/AMP-(fatty) acid ligase